MFSFFKYPKFKAIEYPADGTIQVAVKTEIFDYWRYLSVSKDTIALRYNERYATRFKSYESAEDAIKKYLEQAHEQMKREQTIVRKVQII